MMLPGLIHRHGDLAQRRAGLIHQLDAAVHLGAVVDDELLDVLGRFRELLG